MDRTALKTAAAKYGTPLYLFDLDAFTARAEKVRAAFGSHVQLCYSMKANPFVLRGLPDVFRWVEVCSPGELTICEKLGIAPERILYSGVNKGADDVARAVALGADLLTAESTLHFDLICAAAAAQGKHVRVLPRLTAGSQFGMDPAALEDLVARRAEFRNVTIVGIHYFSGTQKRKDAVIAKELAHLDEYLTMLHDKYGFTAQHVEYGPGLNAECLRDDAEARDGALLDAAAEHIRAFGEKYPLTIEMGRFFAAPCGTFLTGVADAKCNLGVNYAVCDGGMHQVKYDGQLMGMQSPPLTLLRESADAAMQQAVAEQMSEAKPVSAQEEIEAANTVFEKYGFAFYDLAASSPKSDKTRRSCAVAVGTLLHSPVLFASMQNAHSLPIKALAQQCGVSARTLTRHRDYIVAAALLIDGDYPILCTYLQTMRKEAEQCVR